MGLLIRALLILPLLLAWAWGPAWGQVTSNNLRAVGAASGSAPSLIAEGLDTNIDITLTPKGTGVVNIPALTLTSPITLTTATDPFTVNMAGTPADVSLRIVPKGTGGLIITPATTGATALTLTGGTVTTSSPLLSGTQTWNAAGVAFIGTRYNYTRTAASDNSLIADWQIGGASYLRLSGSTLGILGPTNYGHLLVTPPATSEGGLAVDSPVTGYTANTATMANINATSYWAPTGAVATRAALNLENFANGGAGAITSLMGVRVLAARNAAPNPTDIYGVYVRNDAGASTSRTGVYVEAQTGGVTNYHFYQGGSTGRNDFEGFLNLGTATGVAQTRTTSQPLIDATQTWNAAGVSFVGLNYGITNTASAAGSRVWRVQVGGTNIIEQAVTGALTITPNATGASALTITGGTVTTDSTPLAITQTWNAGGATFNTISATITSTAFAAASKLLSLSASTGATANLYAKGGQLTIVNATVPTCNANCGATATIAGSDTFFKITTAGAGVASPMTVTFNGTWPTGAPACVASGTSAVNLVTSVTTTTTTVVIATAAGPTAADVYYVHCGGIAA